ncbi:hypothetical protein OIK40_08870 [Erythrobacter sp. sf7]|uniref:PRC-barrel domain-containing protein n=1 Tax=Erythrobacter fulvus TaxID=2987523 RepID=A0ABT5JT67_9SPHN|nr:hypothetical protein [Erythrobacter fulvus]MDC8754752.1 hypothetical protein [Erythrobacter fulvus]
MKKLILAASVLALFPATANAQLLGSGGLGGGLGGTIGGTLGGTIDNTTRSVRGTVDGTMRGEGSTRGSQAVDARRGTVSAERSAGGSLTGSTSSLADLVVPPVSGMASANGTGSANGQGSANAQLIGTDSVTGAVMPAAQDTQGLALNAAGTATGTASGMIAAAPMPALPGLPALPVGGSAGGEGNGAAAGNGSASLANPLLAAAGSGAAAGQGVTSVAPGMPVMTPEGASLGEVREVVANGRGEVEQVVVKQGNVTRTLPAGMFSASGNALVAGNASGNAAADSAERSPAEGAEAE